MLIGAMLACQPVSPQSKGKAMSVTYQAKVREPRWVAGARVVVDLKIENNGDTPFETPDPMYRTSAQPHFEVTTPDGRKQAFTPDSKATEWDRAQPPTLVRLAPGAHWEGDLALSTYVNLDTPGQYTLRSWIENQGSRIESDPSSFQITGNGTRSLVMETSLDENRSAVVEAVELMDDGRVASSILNEQDPRNAELLPFNRIERGSTEPDAEAIFAPYSNFSVGLSSLRWVIVEKKRQVIIGHNLNAARRTLFGGAELSRILPPVATSMGLYVSGVRNNDLVLTRVTGSERGIQEGTVWTIGNVPSLPVASTLTLSPAAEGNVLLFVLAWSANQGTRLQLLKVSSEGKVLARGDHMLRDLLPLGPAAAGWSSGKDIRVSLLVSNATKATEIRATELRVSSDMTLEGSPRFSDTIQLSSPAQDTRIAYFEAGSGQLSRMILVRSAGATRVISSEGMVRAPRTAVPVTGPLTILPGQVHWYGVWPQNGLLTIGPL
jgi:hypothetical protein